MDAFDADVLIYAAGAGNPRGEPVRALMARTRERGSPVAGIGSALLVPEMLSKPHRLALDRERDALQRLLAEIDLVPCDEAIADLSVLLSARHALATVDAVHLATALRAGADRFITNNRRDFTPAIAALEDIDIAYPEDLASSEDG